MEKEMKLLALRAVELCLRGVLAYLDSEEAKGRSRETFWEDKDGDGFGGDIGYFYESLESMLLYIQSKIKKEEN